MGWWSTTIMGGDTPLDCEYEMYEACGVRDDDLYDGVLSKEEINKRVQSNVAAMIAIVDEGEYDEIGDQVLGVMVMRHGCDPQQPIVKKALKMAMGGAKDDGWSYEDDERCDQTCDFYVQLQSYDGTPQEPLAEGLFEKLIEKINSGEPGLVNL